MAIEDFHNYLNSYADIYYSKYMLGLDLIGDFFCAMKSDDELDQWLERVNYSNLHPYRKTSVPSPMIPTRCDNAGKDQMPAFAVALQEFFYKYYMYPEDKNGPSERKRVTDLENRLAVICHAGRSTIASWKSGSRIPDKYKWWALGIGVFELSYWHIQPYLDMIGCNIDMTCIDDIVLFYALCASKSTNDTFVLLHEYNCDETKQLFAPILNPSSEV